MWDGVWDGVWDGAWDGAWDGVCLRGGDVDAVGERRDDEARCVAQVLERVAEGCIAYVDPHVLLRIVPSLLQSGLELADPRETLLGQ